MCGPSCVHACGRMGKHWCQSPLRRTHRRQSLVPVTNVFRELSQRRCRVSERDDPIGIFRIVLKYLIEILPFVFSDTENAAMIDPKICGELLESLCGGWKVQRPTAVRFVKSSYLGKKQTLILPTPQHPCNHTSYLSRMDRNYCTYTCLRKNT